MTQRRFRQLCAEYLKRLKEIAPKDTGNLAFNSIKIEYPNENTCIIKVDLNVAPYMPYTNEPWIAARWKGKKNPNEGWWEYAYKKCLEELAEKINGEII